MAICAPKRMLFGYFRIVYVLITYLFGRRLPLSEWRLQVSLQFYSSDERESLQAPLCPRGRAERDKVDNT